MQFALSAVALHRMQYPRFHELGHALGLGYDTYSRARAEALTESVTYIVCAGIGLDTGGESVPYVAGWDDEDLAPLREFAHVIDEVARRIEGVLHTNADEAPEPTA